MPLGGLQMASERFRFWERAPPCRYSWKRTQHFFACTRFTMAVNLRNLLYEMIDKERTDLFAGDKNSRA